MRDFGPCVSPPPSPRREFMSGQFHTTQFPRQCVPSQCVESIFRSSGGGAARKRRRRPVPRQYRAAAMRRTEVSERGHRTSVRLTCSFPAQFRGRMYPGPVPYQGAEQGSTPVGGSAIPPRQRSREAAWWDGPGPALARGPSLDGLKTRFYGGVAPLPPARGRGWGRGGIGRRSGASPSSPHCSLMNPLRGPVPRAVGRRVQPCGTGDTPPLGGTGRQPNGAWGRGRGRGGSGSWRW